MHFQLVYVHICESLHIFDIRMKRSLCTQSVHVWLCELQRHLSRSDNIISVCMTDWEKDEAVNMQMVWFMTMHFLNRVTQLDLRVM